MYSTSDVIDLLLRRDRCPAAFTANFRKLQHNRDLCPRLQRKVETVLRAIGRIRGVTYDTQGMRDGGIDVVHVIREGDALEGKIGFQVKSYDDLNETNWLKTLKAQYFDSVASGADLQHLYVVLCTDLAKHREKVRLVAGEFRSMTHVTVVEPAYAWTFLTLPEHRIDAFAKRALDGSDVVTQDAISTLTLPTATARALACYLCAQWLFGSERRLQYSQVMTDTGVSQVYDSVSDSIIASAIASAERDGNAAQVAAQFEDAYEPKEASELIAADLDLLDGSLFEIDQEDGSMTPNTIAMAPIIALVSDAVARYGLDWRSAAAYVSDLVGVPQAIAQTAWGTDDHS